MQYNFENQIFKMLISISFPPFFFTLATNWRKKNNHCLCIKNFGIKSDKLTESEIADTVLNRTDNAASSSEKRARDS